MDRVTKSVANAFYNPVRTPLGVPSITATKLGIRTLSRREEVLPQHSRKQKTSSTRLESQCDKRNARFSHLLPALISWPYLLGLLLVVYLEPHWTSESTWLGAEASIIRAADTRGNIIKRENTKTAVCSRWAQQSAVVNGTLYLYGGHSISTAGQSQNTWSNDFLSVALAEGWEISAPKLTGLPRPSGPPAVANGYLWNSYNSLYLFGGIVSDSPPKTPDPYSLWEYDIKASAWKQHKNPTTSAGNNSDNGNQPIQQAGEGAGITVPGLGRGWYFGGHLDHYTTPGWSIEIARQYLKSIVEFTFPGYTNDGVESLKSGKTAGDDGVWRNVTQGGIQDTNSFTNRADGVLVYVPGYGLSGILLSLAGGTNVSFVGSSSCVGLAA